ncbi:hypothetical protein PtA15_13A454 [Puccinia triticina]|uniref:Uncharacterized protein n=1 Tax=Puccinia triticina TaxID=208348 RepID=A0ABY7D1Q2_9BASI|nr:uncharacterized protein PtA15_13A454 [Puccinia triticina]WAQ91053.1 hypothetical protein PtA15_13A454 [Puccinia triticina]
MLPGFRLTQAPPLSVQRAPRRTCPVRIRPRLVLLGQPLAARGVGSQLRGHPHSRPLQPHPPAKRNRDAEPDEKLSHHDSDSDWSPVPVQVSFPVTYSIWLSTPRATDQTRGPRRDREVSAWTHVSESGPGGMRRIPPRPTFRIEGQVAACTWDTFRQKVIKRVREFWPVHAAELRCCHESDELVWQLIKTECDPAPRMQFATIANTQTLLACLTEISQAGVRVEYELHISTDEPPERKKKVRAPLYSHIIARLAH